MTQFTDLGLSAPILKALTQEGYDTPTPIQAKAIPPLLEGKDLLGIAQTGTGKTAAFALPILEKLSRSTERVAKGHAKVLILSPTRELAAQIGESFKTYGRNMKFSRAVVFGGTSIGKQVELCRGGLDVLVATPGRLVDLIERRAISLSKIEILVLDEVDQMLDLGFIHAIRRIVALLPKQRQNLFFSATMPKEIAGLAAGLLTNPVRVEVAPAATTIERVSQSVIHVEQAAKLPLLNDLLKDNNMTRTLVFCRTKHGADKVVRGLAQANYTASAIHGNKSQANREKALAGFKAGKIMVLVATDIAARGIDIDGVSHVINFDLPHVPESYVHRIGRTARAGAEGSAIALCAGDERSLLRDIERTIRMSIPVTIHPLGKAEVPQGGKEARRPNGRSMKPQSDRPQRDRTERPVFGDRKPFNRDKPRYEAKPPQDAAPQAPREATPVDPAKEAGLRANWTPMQAEPTVMYQKPKPREAAAERPNQPWFKKKEGFSGAKRGEGRGDFKPRGETRGDFKPRGDRPQGDRPFNDRPKFDRAPSEGAGEARSFDRPRKTFGDKPFGGKPSYNRGPKPAFNRDDKPRTEGAERRDFAPRGDKPFNRDDRPQADRGPRRDFAPRGDKPAFNRDDRPRADRAERRDVTPRADKPQFDRAERPAHAGDKPRGNFGDKPRGNFAGGKPRSKFGGGKPGGFDRPKRPGSRPVWAKKEA